VFRAQGVGIVRTPIRAPNANAFCERWVGTVRAECLDWTLILGRRHLERVLRTYAAHYNQARPHRGLDLRTPIGDPWPPMGDVRLRMFADATYWAASSTSTETRHEFLYPTGAVPAQPGQNDLDLLLGRELPVFRFSLTKPPWLWERP
jgi:hypothetical protein